MAGPLYDRAVARRSDARRAVTTRPRSGPEPEDSSLRTSFVVDDTSVATS